MCTWPPDPGVVLTGLGEECRGAPGPVCHGLHHVLEHGVLVRGDERLARGDVDLQLAGAAFALHLVDANAAGRQRVRDVGAQTARQAGDQHVVVSVTMIDRLESRVA